MYISLLMVNVRANATYLVSRPKGKERSRAQASKAKRTKETVWTKPLLGVESRKTTRFLPSGR